MRRTRIGLDGIREELSEDQKETINEALYYAVRENYNARMNESKTEIMREALDIMKVEEKKPITNIMCDIALDDFFRACEVRGWANELHEIPWLKIEERQT